MGKRVDCRGERESGERKCKECGQRERQEGLESEIRVDESDG